MKTMRTTYLALILGLIGFTSCNKEKDEAVTNKQENNRTTLASFIEDRETTAERDFLMSAEIINNNEILERQIQQDRVRDIDWRQTNTDFRWDCIHCVGACEVRDPFPLPGDIEPFPFLWPGIDANSVSGVIDAGAGGLKLQLYPSPDELECAFTADGFFPIYENIYLTMVYCDMMGLEHGTYIESGVYAANYDAAAGAFTSVVLNLAL